MLKKVAFLIGLASLLIPGFSQPLVAESTPESKSAIELHNEEDTKPQTDTKKDNQEDNQASMSALFFIIIALIIGAGTRHLLKNSFLPYTVALLIIGIVLGLLVRFEFLTHSLSALNEAVEWAGNIDPHLILSVFLPTLIFEAAFAMDVHTFKKSFTNATLMAVPGLIITIGLTGSFIILLTNFNIGFTGWNWSLAILFGALISATDPVAVVSLLKHMGTSKKLGTLIEGESLLNDGTAIVIFMVFLTIITGGTTQNSIIVEFLRIALGGALLGVGIGLVTMWWVGRVFNDALVEISIFVAAAYLTFYIAEHFINVSGVLGVVSFGLMMAGTGRTKISPKVEHFLHKFWELLAFIANTLIFLIVGLIIAQKTVFTPYDLLILLFVYLGIHIIRGLVIGLFFPLMQNTGYGIRKKEAYVLWWGALRGAIGLALALVVARTDPRFISERIRDQFLFLTAGVVTLTLLINATTIGWLVRKLGFTQLSPAKKTMIEQARHYLRQSLENWVAKMKSDRYMNRANWNRVREYYPEQTKYSANDKIQAENIAEIRRRILEKEKSSYWHQFKEGMIGEEAVRNLTETINEILDHSGHIPLSQRKNLEQLWKTPNILHKLSNIPVVGIRTKRMFFDRLSMSYDAARGFLDAQNEALKLVGSMYRHTEDNQAETLTHLSDIEKEINENKIQGQTFIRNLRKNYPEIYAAISTRQATRSMLNYEMKTIERLKKNGQISNDEAEKMIADVEKRLKQLIQQPPEIQSPEILQVLHHVEWLQEIDQSTLQKIINQFQHQIFSVGDHILKEDTIGDSIYIIIRGSVKVSYRHKILEVLGPANTIGEMSTLTGFNRRATVIAESPVTALRIKILKLHRLLQDYPEMSHQLWKLAGKRFALQLLADSELAQLLTKKNLNSLLDKGRIYYYNQEEKVYIHSQIALLLTGKAVKDTEKDRLLKAPDIITNAPYVFVASDSRLYIFGTPSN